MSPSWSTSEFRGLVSMLDYSREMSPRRLLAVEGNQAAVGPNILDNDLLPMRATGVQI